MVQVVEDVAAAIALPVDVEESEDAYVFIADVPGLEKGDIKVRCLLFPCRAHAERLRCSLQGPCMCGRRLLLGVHARCWLHGYMPQVSC